MRDHERERFHTPHWVLDDRYHHNHFYPSIGYSLTILPAGHIGISHGRGRFFYHSGVWYQPGPSGYVVVRPPVGVVAPVLPPAYAAVWAGGAPYYYANDICYVQAPGAPAQPAAGTWYYCESAKGYYPYVATCNEGWRSVPATLPQAR